MNSYERYIGMVKGQAVDYVPRIPILMHFAAKYINASYADFARDYQVQTAANQRLVEDFGFDWMIDMEQARRTLGSRVTLTGNLDPVNVIMRSTPDEIKRGFREIYDKVGNSYFVNAGCEIPVGTPEANLKALCEPIPVRR